MEDVVTFLMLHPVAFAAANLVFLFAVFRPLEVHFPGKLSQRFFRPQWWVDFCFYWGQFLIWNALLFWCLWSFRDYIHWLVPEDFRTAVASQPWWLQVIEVVFLSDFINYWTHRLQHRWDFLWRFHAVHHSSEHLDWLAAAREHPVDTVYSVLFINLPMFALGFPIATLTGFIAFQGVWAVFIHSNVKLSIGPLRMLIGAPELHHWHHDRARDAGNYANLSPLMDLMFGTYYCPGHEPVCFGTRDPLPTTYLGHLVRPFLPRRAKEKPSPPEKHEPDQSGASGSTNGGQLGMSIRPNGFTTS